jgi:hypothetical protein
MKGQPTNTSTTPMDQLLQVRQDVFPVLTPNEITERSKISVLRASTDSTQVTFLSEIIKGAEQHTEKFIAVDLRHYKDLLTGNVIFCNIADEAGLARFKENSKFTQGTFIIINFKPGKIEVIPGPKVPPTEVPMDVIINVPGLKGSEELVFNVSDVGATATQAVKTITGNVKFASPDQCPACSVIAEHVPGLGVDFREAATPEFLTTQFDFTVLSLKETCLLGGKWTKAKLKNVFNEGMTGHLDEYKYCDVGQYSDLSGHKLGTVELAGDECCTIL